MRKIIDNQLTFGNVDISQIKTDPKSRDEIDKTVRGLQDLYTNTETRTAIFKLLSEQINPKVSKKTGRRGMDLWKILVLGVIRQACYWDYDKLHHMSNNNLMIRQLLGHDRDDWRDTYYYELQTIKDNVSLLTEDLLIQVSDIVVGRGHSLLSIKKKEELRTSVDSFVVKTDIHYPTDSNLLFDSMRKSIQIIRNISDTYNIDGWRQSVHNIKILKQQLRQIQKINHAGGLHKDEKSQTAHRHYIFQSQVYLMKIAETLTILEKQAPSGLYILALLVELDNYLTYARHQIELIERRIFQGESIPNSDKIFSIFEPYTRWISKGKAGVRVEFGVPVSIIKDQHGYILAYEIMETTSDVHAAVPLSAKAVSKYPSIKSISCDQGFWSVPNRQAIGELVEMPVMPKKGRRNKTEQAEESSPEFKKLRKHHSSVESAINGLNHSGLEKCYDHGIHGFRRCVALSILARNIQTLGNQILVAEAKRRARKKHKKAA